MGAKHAGIAALAAAAGFLTAGFLTADFLTADFLTAVMSVCRVLNQAAAAA